MLQFSFADMRNSSDAEGSDATPEPLTAIPVARTNNSPLDIFRWLLFQFRNSGFEAYKKLSFLCHISGQRWGLALNYS